MEAVPDLSIVVPVYNEEALLERSLERLFAAIRESGISAEVIAIDDGSKDASPRILASLREKFSGDLKVLSEPNNRGIGASIRLGLSAASGRHVTVSPVDSPLTPSVLSRLSRAASRADVVVTARRRREGYSPLMRFNSWLLMSALNVISGMSLRDWTWVHCYNTVMVKDLPIRSEGVFFFPEILLRLGSRPGTTFCEIEVEMVPRTAGTPSAGRISVILKTLREAVTFFISSGVRVTSRPTVRRLDD